MHRVMNRLGFAWIFVVSMGCGPTSETETAGDGTEASTTADSQTTDESATQTSTSDGPTTATTASSASASSDDGTASASTGSDTSGTDTGGTEIECVTDDDCKLDNDCCGCNAAPLDERFPPCPADCAQGMCDQWGIEQAVCRFGVCVVDELACNPADAICAVPAPACDDGFTAEVANGCWTGACVPVELCDWVPDCTACTEEEVCVHMLGGPGPVVAQRFCEPIPLSCNGTATCACIGDAICEGIGTCEEQGENEIACVGK